MSLLGNTKLNRFLQKEPDQSDDTKSAVYAGTYPAQKNVDTSLKKSGQATGNESDNGAPNILTATVITSCFIQTTALPSRIQMSGNDLTFYDNTYDDNGVVKGDTSRIFFTHDLNVNEGYVIEKRASVFSTYDNVISWYAYPAKAGSHNYMFIGRNATLADQERNVLSMHFNIDTDPSIVSGSQLLLNGIFEIEYSTNGVQAQSNNKVFLAGNSPAFFPGLTGFSSIIIGGSGGISGLAYADDVTNNILAGFYIKNQTTIELGMNMIPDTANAYDIGSAAFPIRNIYAAGIVPTGLAWYSGFGSPEGVVGAPIGSLYSNKSGGTSTTLYVKTSGAGNTGWTAK